MKIYCKNNCFWFATTGLRRPMHNITFNSAVVFKLQQKRILLKNLRSVLVQRIEGFNDKAGTSSRTSAVDPFHDYKYLFVNAYRACMYSAHSAVNAFRPLVFRWPNRSSRCRGSTRHHTDTIMCRWLDYPILMPVNRNVTNISFWILR